MNTLRWALLLGTEVIFWVGLITFFALRYGLKRQDWSRLVLIFVIAEHIALLLFGIVDFFRTGILTYMLIWGRKDLARLDGWVARRVLAWQNGRGQRSV
jgi:hypothetical protein